ncbi:MAG: hypothetical protein LJF30_04295 [Acidobacteria bacterium]|nr:hypothetical protein [Acidobacteriota bacterium]
MSGLWPSAAEESQLRFAFPLPDLRTRILLAAALFAVGLAIWTVAPAGGWIGLVLVLAGHLPLWVRHQSNAPGGATPDHEEVWAPVEDDWLDRVTALEESGRRWDTTPWDLSNVRGCLTLVALLVVLGFAVVAAGAVLGADSFFRLAVAAPLLLVPLWLNGLRTTWNPSELRKKGEALAVARAQAERLGAGDFDPVPMLALREGRRGKYPVDARLMLRPAREDESGFLGVQVQVAMNNVKGTDYPYLYAVVLGKGDFRMPPVSPRQRRDGVDIVFERDESEGVRFLVVRQHADKHGGWHTESEHILAIVAAALEKARAVWRDNGGEVTG